MRYLIIALFYMGLVTSANAFLADFDEDGDIDFTDVGAFEIFFGINPNNEKDLWGDLNFDEVIDFSDLGVLDAIFRDETFPEKNVILFAGGSYCNGSPPKNSVLNKNVEGGLFWDLSQTTGRYAQDIFNGRMFVQSECEAGATLDALSVHGTPRPGFRTLEQQIDDGLAKNSGKTGKTRVKYLVITGLNDGLHSGGEVLILPGKGVYQNIDPLNVFDHADEVSAFLIEFRTIIEEYASDGLQIIIIQMPPLSEDIANNDDNKYGINLSAVSRKFSRHNGLLFDEVISKNLYRQLQTGLASMENINGVYVLDPWSDSFTGRNFREIDGIHYSYKTGKMAGRVTAQFIADLEGFGEE